jgi:hypothetical protein
MERALSERSGLKVNIFLENTLYQSSDVRFLGKEIFIRIDWASIELCLELLGAIQIYETTGATLGGFEGARDEVEIHRSQFLRSKMFQISLKSLIWQMAVERRPLEAKLFLSYYEKIIGNRSFPNVPIFDRGSNDPQPFPHFESAIRAFANFPWVDSDTLIGNKKFVDVNSSSSLHWDGVVADLYRINGTFPFDIFVLPAEQIIYHELGHALLLSGRLDKDNAAEIERLILEISKDFDFRYHIQDVVSQNVRDFVSSAQNDRRTSFELFCDYQSVSGIFRSRLNDIPIKSFSYSSSSLNSIVFLRNFAAKLIDVRLGRLSDERLDMYGYGHWQLAQRVREHFLSSVSIAMTENVDDDRRARELNFWFRESYNEIMDHAICVADGLRAVFPVWFDAYPLFGEGYSSFKDMVKAFNENASSEVQNEIYNVCRSL